MAYPMKRYHCVYQSPLGLAETTFEADPIASRMIYADGDLVVYTGESVERIVSNVVSFEPVDAKEEPEAQPSKEPPMCRHEDWIVRGSDKIGKGTCNDCGVTVGLNVLLNGTVGRLRVLEKKLAELVEPYYHAPEVAK